MAMDMVGEPARMVASKMDVNIFNACFHQRCDSADDNGKRSGPATHLPWDYMVNGNGCMPACLSSGATTASKAFNPWFRCARLSGSNWASAGQQAARRLRRAGDHGLPVRRQGERDHALVGLVARLAHIGFFHQRVDQAAGRRLVNRHLTGQFAHAQA